MALTHKTKEFVWVTQDEWLLQGVASPLSEAGQVCMQEPPLLDLSEDVPSAATVTSLLDDPAEVPMDVPAETPLETPTEVPAEPTPVEGPVENLAEAPVQAPLEGVLDNALPSSLMWRAMIGLPQDCQ